MLDKAHMQIFTFLTILLFVSACKPPVKKELQEEKEHPKLIKTIGDPRYGNIYCSLQDNAGNLWFGTTENGLYKYDGKSFQQFLEADGLNSNSINDILQDKEGKIWIGTKNGLNIYNPSPTLSANGKMFTEIQIPLPKNLPPNTNKFYQTHIVQDIMQDHSGKLWFATIDGVYIYDGKSFNLFPIVEAENGFLSSNDKVERVFEDKAGNIWLGGRTNKGVYRYDGKTITNFELKELTIINESARFEKDRIINHSWAWPQLQDKNGNIWFSNWAGAYRYDGKTFTSFTKSDGLPGNYGLVAKIIEDKNGNLWFGGDGLCRYDGKAFISFSTKDGLPNLGIWTILEDKSGNIWVGTRETGLYLYDGKTFITYSEYKP